MYKWTGQNSDYAIYAGRLERYKKLDTAAKLAEKLGLNFIIAGDRPYKRFLARKNSKIIVRQPRDKYLELAAGARYVIDLSSRGIFSFFIAEALTIGVPSIVSEEIKRSLVAEGTPLDEYILVAKTPLGSWDGVVRQRMKLYEDIGHS